MISDASDTWVPTTCGICLYHCGIKVLVKDGVAVRIEGDETNPDNLGKLCPRGPAGLLRHYDPYRVKSPVVRTNPKKGFDVDPQWKEISWSEAFDIVTEKLRKTRKDDPRKLLPAFSDFQKVQLWAWPMAFGSPNNISSTGGYCGAAYHPVNQMTDGTFAAVNDYFYCKYWIEIGTGDGFSGHLHLPGSAKRHADARIRGMKYVVVDPQLSPAASKADEWISIRPATDRALVLSMIHVLLHELGIYDAAFLKRKTNAPYLVGSDGYLVRDKNTMKPYIWDPVDNSPKLFDDPSIKDIALEGGSDVSGIKCKSAFQVFKDITKDYTPERMSQITTVPAETIRRLAKEFGEAASIGSTITIDGIEYPYRPAAINYYRGAQMHQGGLLDNLTFKMINMLVGNIDVPGGHIGIPGRHTGQMFKKGHMIFPGRDGMIDVDHIHHMTAPFIFKYPPDSTHLAEYFPLGEFFGHITVTTLLDPNRFGLQYQPEVIFTYHCNPLWNLPGTNQVIEICKKMDFLVCVDILFNETVEMADVVLPDHSYLESYALCGFEMPFTIGHTLRQPVVKPLYTTMEGADILTELADRLEFLDAWNNILNFAFGIEEEYRLKSDKKYGWEDILDRFAKSMHGEEYGLEWFKKHGHKVRLQTPREKYQPHGELRMPFYWEHVKRTGEDLKNNFLKHSIDWDTSHYLPLPAWTPNTAHEQPGYDMYAISFKTAQTTFSDTVTIPVISELTEKQIPYHQGILINSKTANAQGIRDGDPIRVRSFVGEVMGYAKLTEGIHPEVVAVSNAITRWAAHPTIRSLKHKNVKFNTLVPPFFEYMDNASASAESAVKVTISRG